MVYWATWNVAHPCRDVWYSQVYIPDTEGIVLKKTQQNNTSINQVNQQKTPAVKDVINKDKIHYTCRDILDGMCLTSFLPYEDVTNRKFKIAPGASISSFK